MARRKRSDALADDAAGAPTTTDGTGNGEQAQAPPTEAQLAAQAARIAARPRYWLVRLDSMGKPSEVMGSFKSQMMAMRKIDEYAFVLRAAATDLAIFRCKPVYAPQLHVGGDAA